MKKLQIYDYYLEKIEKENIKFRKFHYNSHLSISHKNIFIN